MDGHQLTESIKCKNKHQIRLTVSCFGLKKHKNIGFLSKINPQAVLLKKIGKKWIRIAKTEVITGISNPIFFTQIQLDDSFLKLKTSMLNTSGLKKASDMDRYSLKM
jgi:hypothetical protein